MDTAQRVQSVLCRRIDELYFACHITLPFYRHESSWDLFQKGNPWQLLTGGERDYWCHLWSCGGGWLTHNFFLKNIWTVPSLPISREQTKPSVTLFGPILFNHTSGFIWVNLWIHRYGKIWKKWKCSNSYSFNFTHTPPWKMVPSESTVRRGL